MIIVCLCQPKLYIWQTDIKSAGLVLYVQKMEWKKKEEIHITAYPTNFFKAWFSQM